MTNLAWENLFITLRKYIYINYQRIRSIHNTLTICCSETRGTNTTKTFTGESSLTGAIVQTRAATTGILLEEENYKELNRILLHNRNCYY